MMICVAAGKGELEGCVCARLTERYRELLEK